MGSEEAKWLARLVDLVERPDPARSLLLAGALLPVVLRWASDSLRCNASHVSMMFLASLGRDCTTY